MPSSRAIDPATGEVLPDRATQPVPPDQPPDLPPLDTPDDILDEMRQCYWRMEVVARRIGEARRERDGHYVHGEYHSGVLFDYTEALEQNERTMWEAHKKGETKWPSEQTRKAVAHASIPSELRIKLSVLDKEVKNLDAYQRILESQMDALRSFLSYHKEEAKLAGGPATEPPPDPASPWPPAPPDGY